MAAFIDVVKKGKSSGKKQHPDSREQAEPDYPSKFIASR